MLHDRAKQLVRVQDGLNADLVKICWVSLRIAADFADREEDLLFALARVNLRDSVEGLAPMGWDEHRIVCDCWKVVSSIARSKETRPRWVEPVSESLSIS